MVFFLKNQNQKKRGDTMKKILALALSLTLALSLCACGGDTTGDTARTPTPAD